MSAFLPPHSLEHDVSNGILLANVVKGLKNLMLDPKFIYSFPASFKASVVVDINITARNDLVVKIFKGLPS